MQWIVGWHGMGAIGRPIKSLRPCVTVSGFLSSELQSEASVCVQADEKGGNYRDDWVRG